MGRNGKRKKFLEQPGTFWLGVGLISELPLNMAWPYISEKLCNLSLINGCPPPAWVLIIAGIVSFFIVAWLGYLFGLGEKSDDGGIRKRPKQ